MTSEDIKNLITQILISGEIRDIGVKAENVIVSESENLSEKLQSIDDKLANANIPENILVKSDIRVEDNKLIIDNN